MTKRLTLAGLKKSLKAGDVKISGDLPTPKTKRRKKSTQSTEAELEILRAQREKLRNKFLDHWRFLGGAEVWVPEYTFHPERQWPIDLAIPSLKIMVELDGGTWSRKKTGHNWGVGIRRDHEKQNAAVALGWRPFRYTTDMLSKKDGPVHIAPLLAFVRRATEKAGKFTMKADT